MKKKTAVMVDGEWFRKSIQYVLRGNGGNGGNGGDNVDAEYVYSVCARALDAEEEELFRLFYYDAKPYEKRETNPIDNTAVDFSDTPQAHQRNRYHQQLSRMDYVALRLGVLKQKGWRIRNRRQRDLMRNAGDNATLQAADIQLVLEQKGVDMRIGLDVATLSLKGLVDRIALLSGDTDMVPAMKLARKEGVQVVAYQIEDYHNLPAALVHHADFVRNINVREGGGRG